MRPRHVLFPYPGFIRNQKAFTPPPRQQRLASFVASVLRASPDVISGFARHET